MIIRLQNYFSVPRIVSFSVSVESAEDFQRDNLQYTYVDGNNLCFWPDGYHIEMSPKVSEQISLCNDYDVWDISSDGMMIRVFDSASSENAFVLTGRCNSNCVMCPMPDLQRKKDGPSLEKNLEIIRHIPSDTEHITITGGEPFLYGNDIFSVLEAMRTRFASTEFQLLTNGRALSNQLCFDRFCSTAPEKMMIGIPLHGFSAETHDVITRSPGGFRQTVSGIHNLLRWKKSIELRIVVSKLNYKNISQIAEFIVREFRNVARVEIMGLEMLGNAVKFREDVWISYSDAFEACRNAIDILVENAVPVGLYNFPLCAVDRRYRFLAKKSISGNKVRFPEICSTCSVQDACGGFFYSSLKFAENDVKPVRIC